MSIKLVAITDPVILDENGKKLTPDQFIAYCARVSNPGNQNNTETAGKLIKYLLKQGHWSPFEMVHLVFEVKTTRDIGRQILRHTAKFQEFSQRYAVATEFTTREARLQDTKNRQNSIETDNQSLSTIWECYQKNIAKDAQEAYQWALDNGIAKEQARAVLPEGLTISTMYMANNLRGYIHWIDARTNPATQKEHRLIAEECKAIVLENFPSLKDYWNHKIPGDK